MEFLSYLVLILLSLVAYSGGAVGKAGKTIELKPSILDLIIILVLWTGAVYSRISLDFNKWLMVLIWIVIGSLVGIIVVWIRRPKPTKTSPSKTHDNKLDKTLLKRLLTGWAGFSRRLGSFQSRVLLSMVYFIVVFPFALGVRILGDPLKIKHKVSSSYWNPREEMRQDLDSYRRQF